MLLPDGATKFGGVSNFKIRKVARMRGDIMLIQTTNTIFSYPRQGVLRCLWTIFVAIILFASRAWGVSDGVPDVKPEYQKFFRHYKSDRSMPADVLQAHGINDNQIGKSYALIAGVSSYPNLPPDKRSLQPAKNDIDNLVNFLKKKEFFDEIIVLEDGDVNLANFNYFLQVYLPHQMGDKQTSRFLFAYSGHGFDDNGASYLLTNTAASLSDVSSGIDLSQLKVAIEKVVIKALNSIILINSCQGGSFLSRIPFGPNRALLATFGAHAITAGAKGQLTYGSGAGHSGSYFFDEVIEGLNGGADFDGGGIITADQLYSFVRTQVQEDTNQDQDPQFGDVAPHLSRGSFFFIDPTPSPVPIKTSISTAESPCAFALFSDYYIYALKNNLQDDILRLVNAEDWYALQQSPAEAVFFTSGRAFLGGAYPLGDDYQTFDQKRTAHFKNILYDRNIQQAADIIQLTMGDRSYDSFSDCIRRQLSMPTLKAWASRETTTEIEVHVKYIGPHSRGVDVKGALSGGSVIGAAQGSLFQQAIHLRKNEEHVITIHRNKGGDGQVHIELNASDGSTSLLNYKRADAILSVQFNGTFEVLREANHRVEAHTPNNNENRGSCEHEVGHRDGKYCTSRTTVSVSAAEHRFLKNARFECAGFGCPWTQAGTIQFSPDQSSVSASLDNWGSAVQAILIVDEYEKISAQECAGTGSIPVIYDRPVLLAVTKECLPVAYIKWVRIPTLADGEVLPFGTQTPGTQLLMNGSINLGDTSVAASYSLTSDQDPDGQPVRNSPLTQAARDVWESRRAKYDSYRSHKAVAVSDGGYIGLSENQPTSLAAKNKALFFCKDFVTKFGIPSDRCFVIMADDTKLGSW
jgi:hypothetical protein